MNLYLSIKKAIVAISFFLCALFTSLLCVWLLVGIFVVFPVALLSTATDPEKMLPTVQAVLIGVEVLSFPLSFVISYLISIKLSNFLKSRGVEVWRPKLLFALAAALFLAPFVYAVIK